MRITDRTPVPFHVEPDARLTMVRFIDRRPRPVGAMQVTCGGLFIGCVVAWPIMGRVRWYMVEHNIWQYPEAGWEAFETPEDAAERLVNNVVDWRWRR